MSIHWSCKLCNRCFSTFREVRMCENLCLAQRASEAGDATAEAEGEENAIQPDTDTITRGLQLSPMSIKVQTKIHM